MAKVKRKRPYPKKQPNTPMPELSKSGEVHALKVAELAVDLWKIHLRSRADLASDRVIAACERAEDRLRRLGFELETLEGKAYDTNMCVRVIDHLPSVGPLMVAECLSPAVFFNQHLIREAEVVTKGGGEENG
jgi:hypothetical protein